MKVLKILDKLVPDVEQVIDVPMIFPEDFRIRTLRSSLQEPQLAEQLVEVPPIVPQLVGFFAGADGYVWRQLSGPTGEYWWRVGSSHTQWTARPGRCRNTGPV